MDYSDLDIRPLLAKAATESRFGEGDSTLNLDLQRLDFLLRQFNPMFTMTGLGAYINSLDDREKRALMSPYYFPREWRD